MVFLEDGTEESAYSWEAEGLLELEEERREFERGLGSWVEVAGLKTIFLSEGLLPLEGFYFVDELCQHFLQVGLFLESSENVDVFLREGSQIERGKSGNQKFESGSFVLPRIVVDSQVDNVLDLFRGKSTSSFRSSCLDSPRVLRLALTLRLNSSCFRSSKVLSSFESCSTTNYMET